MALDRYDEQSVERIANYADALFEALVARKWTDEAAMAFVASAFQGGAV